MELYNTLLQRYNRALPHFRNCKCNCAINQELLLVHDCLNQIARRLREIDPEKYDIRVPERPHLV
jgi:hypothetical protein